jgi:molybdopterin-guanine dinucleotide biosynthesis protein A
MREREVPSYWRGSCLRIRSLVRLLVVGEPGSGKTSWCREYIDWRRESGSSVGGILCPAIEKQRQRVGSDAIDLLTGQEVPFARLSRLRRFKGGEVVGDYTVSRRGILLACGAIRRAVESRCDLVVIDEVGPLELAGKGLMSAVELALASAANLLIVVRSSLKEALQRHFPQYEFVVAADLTQPPSNMSKLGDSRSGAATYESPTESCQAQETK